MRAIVFEALGAPMRVRRVEDPTPGPDEVVLKTRACGICGTDLHMTTAGHGLTYPTPCVLGHEFSGEIVAVGSAGSRHRVGDRVAVMPLWPCGTCAACLDGRPNKCVPYDMVGIGRVPGGYAEFTKVKDACALRLPDELGYEVGALVEPLAVALRGVRMARLQPTFRVLILGAGPIGLSAAFWSRRLGAARVAVAASSKRRAPVALRMGIDQFVAGSTDWPKAVCDVLDGAPDIVIECVGNVGSIDQAISAAGVGGTVVVLGFCTRPDSIVPATAVIKELTVRFSMVYDRRDYADVINVLARGAHEPLAMITRTVGLHEFPAAFEELRGPSPDCKVMLDPWNEGVTAP